MKKDLDFETRKRSVERVLAETCRTSGLLDILGRRHAWAIVGGVVRDSMLVRDPHTRLFFNPWPDMDVAFAQSEIDAERQFAHIEGAGASVRRNSFGGWKLSVDRLGELDIWRITLDDGRQPVMLRWFTYLQNIDFGINAIAFAWPEAKIAIHPLWYKSYQRKRILRLCPEPAKRHLQAIRAIALAVKLEQLTGLSFTLGGEVASDLKCLVASPDETLTREALSYLHAKTDSGRWPKHVLEAFLYSSAREAPSPLFSQLVKEILNQDIEQYARLSKRRSPRVKRGAKSNAPLLSDLHG